MRNTHVLAVAPTVSNSRISNCSAGIEPYPANMYTFNGAKGTFIVKNPDLEKLLKDEVKSRFRTNVVKDKKFSELLQNALTKYQNRSIEAAQVIAELIEMAKEFKKDIEKTNELDLNPAENAFYDALSNNKSAEELMGEEVLLQIAREIAEKLRKNITVDWSVRESVRARLRLLVKSLLRKYKYPPDQQDEAVELVLSQAEVISEEWAVN